jgi:AbrB family looped-hinge helix DNA binding protein
MSAIVEIDKAGRIVVPKNLRDALYLTPGTRLKIERSGDTLMLIPSASEAQLVIQNGTPLIFPADRSSAPILTDEMVNEVIAQGRMERERRLLTLDGDSVADAADYPGEDAE